jgi:hypothetical protein
VRFPFLKTYKYHTAFGDDFAITDKVNFTLAYYCMHALYYTHLFGCVLVLRLEADAKDEGRPDE